ncbi:MAG: sensor histidine kinase, partial [Candidatus Omnitrophica bacterium]|nr:sensor histidine kinase [Candidatus Omnitrophota bacterium]
EIHHRVKNNLQIVSSLINLQAQYIKNKEDINILRQSERRIKTMALIHEELYGSEDISRIDFAQYVQKLVDYLLSSYSIPTCEVKIEIDVRDVYFGIDTAIPCGLIINEIVSNSFKYAFPLNMAGKERKISITLHPAEDTPGAANGREGKGYILVVKDNGVGFPGNIDWKDTKTLGMQLVVTLVEQIHGTIAMSADGGTEFKIIFFGWLHDQGVRRRMRE